MIRPGSKISDRLTTLVVILLVASALATTAFSGMTTSAEPSLDRQLPMEIDRSPGIVPSSGGGDAGGTGSAVGAATAGNVISNGGFEERGPSGVATNWQPFANGRAQVGWYDETWPEAVKSGDHAQLMEIFQVDGDVRDRVIAIYQTVDVARNGEYNLTLQALMRSDAPQDLRNKDEYEMSWGVDFSGSGNYDNVEKWVQMPLTEQLRIGSNGDFPDDQSLFYETVTGTVRTGNSNRISLFIRGVKKFPTGTEVNFDVDDVSLVGPSQTTVIIKPSDDTRQDSNLPVSGTTLPKNVSVGALFLGALVLIVLGAGATANLLRKQEDQ